MSGHVVTMGETMLLLSGRSVGSVRDLDAVGLDTGGAESNVAIGLVRAGVPTTWVGRVGTDPAGERVLADVRRTGVDVVAVLDPDRSTGLMMKERLPDGRTRVTYHRAGSAGSAVRPEDVPDGLVERAGLVHLTGITTALSDSARAAVDAVLARADTACVPVSFDVNHRPKLVDPDTARQRYRAVAERSSVVFASDDEARLVLGRQEQPDDEESLAYDLAAVADGTAVVKLGSRGAVASVDGVLLRRPATPVRVVDPVGAGDAFVAGWLAAVLTGAGPAEALDRAADAGALACTVPGDWQLPDPDAAARPVDGPEVDHTVHDRVDR
ncbi:2-dehydro-3-deoxygluconokinase [Curtobacterium luteum]|uniref:2-dehydro-3-deoxygluconokinase n=1 Tax=Curtobacterium luteum TaxID=33881 RepID=A0A8H9G9W5_9MICO|nr:sugar kinase [Curtobacterium luteum]MBM7802307.1 2-dehydro-3-deoxygluconokinase [Curtobacterium luteum]NUU52411.1 sugar kinase [Curtobacterium luteum]GGK91816.1 ribokinase [Curtobacterium luteum]